MIHKHEHLRALASAVLPSNSSTPYNIALGSLQSPADTESYKLVQKTCETVNVVGNNPKYRSTFAVTAAFCWCIDDPESHERLD